MSVLRRLATSLGRRDQGPNIELAQQIAQKGDKVAVGELTMHLNHANRSIRHDCIKVLGEIGKLKPRLLAGHHRLFIATLGNADNRMQWGAMAALDAIVAEVPRELYNALDKMSAAVGKGSVITRDHFVSILIKLSPLERNARRTIPLLIEELRICPANQLPLYAEKAITVVDEKNKEKFAEVLAARLDDLDKESKKKRVRKILSKLNGAGGSSAVET